MEGKIPPDVPGIGLLWAVEAIQRQLVCEVLNLPKSKTSYLPGGWASVADGLYLQVCM